MSKSVCLFVCQICISRQMFVYNIIMFISRKFVHVCILYIYIYIYIYTYIHISRYEYCAFGIYEFFNICIL